MTDYYNDEERPGFTSDEPVRGPVPAPGSPIIPPSLMVAPTHLVLSWLSRQGFNISDGEREIEQFAAGSKTDDELYANSSTSEHFTIWASELSSYDA